MSDDGKDIEGSRQAQRNRAQRVPLVNANGDVTEATSPSELRNRLAEGWQPRDPEALYEFGVTNEAGIDSVPVRGRDLAQFLVQTDREHMRAVPLTRGEGADLRALQGLENRQEILQDYGGLAFGRNLLAAGSSDPATSELLDEVDAANPWAATAGLTASLIGPALASAGIGTFANAAGAARVASLARSLRFAGPIGLSEALGLGASRLARAGAASLRLSGSTAAARAAYRAAPVLGLAVEGAAGESLLGLTVAAAHNRPITAEEIFANAGIGGAIGFGMGAGASAFRRAAQRFATHSPGAQLVNDARLMTEAGGEAALARRMVEGAVDVPRAPLAEMSARVAGASEEQLRRIRRAAQPVYQAVVSRAEELIPRLGDDLARGLDDVSPALDNFRNEVRAGAHIRRLDFEGRAANNVIAAIRAPLSTLRNELSDVVSFVGSRQGVGSAEARRALGAVEEVIARYPSVLGKADGAADIFENLVLSRSAVNDALTSAPAEVRMHLEKARMVFDGLIADRAVFGRAAQQHADALALTQSGSDVLDAVRRAMGDKALAEGGARRFSGAKLARGLGRIGDEGEDTFDAIENAAKTLGRTREMAEMLGLASAKNLADSGEVIRRTVESARDYQKVYQDFLRGQRAELMTAGLGRQLAFSAAPVASGAGRAVAGGTLGAILGESVSDSALGTLGGAAGFAALGLFTRPFQFTRQVYQLRQVFRGVGGRMAELSTAVRSVMNQKGRLIEPVRVGRASRAVTAFETYKSHEELRQQYEDVVAELDALRDGSLTLIDRLGQQSQSLARLDPEIAEHFQMVAIRALEYLQANRPQQDVDPLGITEPTPLSVSAMESFLLRFRAIDDPMFLLEQFAAGELQSESVEAVRYVYPELFAAQSAELAAIAADLKGPMSYQVRVQMATWFDVPDPSMEPSFLAAMQSSFYQTEQQARQIQSLARTRNTIATRSVSATERLGG